MEGVRDGGSEGREDDAKERIPPQVVSQELQGTIENNVVCSWSVFRRGISVYLHLS